VTNLQKAINDYRAEMEAHGVKIPKENQKNEYLVACWFLAKYQRLEQRGIATDIIRENAKFIKEMLPELRKQCKVVK
jgi:hypothetical protein